MPVSRRSRSKRACGLACHRRASKAATLSRSIPPDRTSISNIHSRAGSVGWKSWSAYVGRSVSPYAGSGASKVSGKAGAPGAP
jgi:hypothetical protein